MSLTKATLVNLDMKRRHVDEVFTCHFNPNELTITKKNTWNADKAAGANLPPVHFGGAGAQNLQLTLIFDTLEATKGEQDVSKVTAKITHLMEATEEETVKKKKQARPPHVLFTFGSWSSQPSVITDFSQTFTLFNSDGTPVRATVKLTLQEVPDAAPKEVRKGQNPTSEATGTRRVHLVQHGDTIDWIAADELGDAGAWRVLAVYNHLDDPRRLRPGTLLAIPTDEVLGAGR